MPEVAFDYFTLLTPAACHMKKILLYLYRFYFSVAHFCRGSFLPRDSDKLPLYLRIQYISVRASFPSGCMNLSIFYKYSNSYNPGDPLFSAL